MHFGTFPMLKGTVEDFQKHTETFKDEFKRADFKVIDPHTFLATGVPLPN